jgi:hypothetical protein
VSRFGSRCARVRPANATPTTNLRLPALTRADHRRSSARILLLLQPKAERPRKLPIPRWALRSDRPPAHPAFVAATASKLILGLRTSDIHPQLAAMMVRVLAHDRFVPLHFVQVACVVQ